RTRRRGVEKWAASVDRAGSDPTLRSGRRLSPGFVVLQSLVTRFAPQTRTTRGRADRERAARRQEARGVRSDRELLSPLRRALPPARARRGISEHRVLRARARSPERERARSGFHKRAPLSLDIRWRPESEGVRPRNAPPRD